MWGLKPTFERQRYLIFLCTGRSKRTTSELDDRSLRDFKDRISHGFPRYFFHRRSPDKDFISGVCRKLFPEITNFTTGIGYTIYYSGLRSFDNQRMTWAIERRRLADAWLSKHIKYVFLLASFFVKRHVNVCRPYFLVTSLSNSQPFKKSAQICPRTTFVKLFHAFTTRLTRSSWKRDLQDRMRQATTLSSPFLQIRFSSSSAWRSRDWTV